MEKIARCADSGLECDFEARGLTDEELLELCIQHVQATHGMDENPIELAERIVAASRVRMQLESGPYRWRRKAA
jgi:predicted small metal-binding protein